MSSALLRAISRRRPCRVCGFLHGLFAAVILLGGGHRGGPASPPPNILGAAPPVVHLAPAPIVVAARLGATGKIGRGDHRLVAGAVARRGVGLAPAYGQVLRARAGAGPPTGTIASGSGRGGRNELRERSRPRARPPP